MTKKINRQILQSEIKKRIRNSYIYFLSFYIFSVILSLFSKTWAGFFYWPAFHGSIFFYTLLFIFSFEAKINFKRVFKFKDLVARSRLEFIGLTQNSAHTARAQLKKYFNYLYQKLRALSLRTWLKLFLIAISLIFAVYYEIDVIEFLILLFALVSVLFVLDSRYAAGAALVFLIFCPFLIIFKKEALAEVSAIYAYYFLVITVVTQIRELKN